MLLYYITDRHAFAGDERRQYGALLSRIAAAAGAGVDYIQLREKDLSVRHLEELATEAVASVRANSPHTRILINQNADIALACDADGVHLPGRSLPASEVRALWMRVSPRMPVIAVSSHRVDEVRYAEAHGADFVVLAPIFEKPGTELPGLGIDALRIACRGPEPPNNTEAVPKSGFPVFALGGVNEKNAAECLRAGAAGVAGIRLFQQGNLSDTVRRLRELESQ